jgi:hypothetical protein
MVEAVLTMGDLLLGLRDGFGLTAEKAAKHEYEPPGEGKAYENTQQNVGDRTMIDRARMSGMCGGDGAKNS